MRKSLVLLFGRLLITLLFLYVGWVQMYRVMQRDWALWSKLEYDSQWRRDGHVSMSGPLKVVQVLVWWHGPGCSAISKGCAGRHRWQCRERSHSHQ